MRISSTLIGQIAICILWSLPIPTILIQGGGHAMVLVVTLTLLIPIVAFFVLFGTMKNSKGFEFKETRIMIAMLLWVAFWIKSLDFNFVNYHFG